LSLERFKPLRFLQGPQPLKTFAFLPAPTHSDGDVEAKPDHDCRREKRAKAYRDYYVHVDASGFPKSSTSRCPPAELSSAVG
jgi:hypothetical protein